ncbi:MAG: hypothetical protein NZ733_00300 [Aigarchaeota archaeon]|nr:hypothetical protein [Aigarchaeota archaeon]
MGRLLDLNLSPDGEAVELWVRTDGLRVERFRVGWRPSIYAVGPEERLEELERTFQDDSELVMASEVPEKEPRPALKLRVRPRERKEVARRIESAFGREGVRLYNVDVPVLQQFLYEQRLFPTALVEVREDLGELRALDSREDTDYDVSWIRVAELEVSAVQRFEEPLRSVRLVSEEEVVEIDGDEPSVLEGLERAVEPFDVLLADGGDSFVMHYLHHRASVNGIELSLGRERIRPFRSNHHVYWSYGRVYRRHSAFRLRGRVHVDPLNSFVYSHTGLFGLLEVARTCVVPLHDAARYTIGQCMTSLQFEVASRRKALVPWRAGRPLYFTLGELSVMDRGGLTLDHRPGVYWGVAEVDFQSMYPMIILTRNVSAETVNCGCCGGRGTPIPEIGGHTCSRRVGLVPEAISLPLRKRLAYKSMLREGKGDPEVLRARSDALKWVLVSSFGYLGFRKAKFGSRLAHMAVCAHARDALLRAVRVAERMGFEVVHGIVDSLWVRREGAAEEDYSELVRAIEEETGLPAALEGTYRWIAFLPSKSSPLRPVNGRYFGFRTDGRAKFRGIEARRSDTPPLVARMQLEMLEVLSRVEAPQDLPRAVEECFGVLRRYERDLVLGRVGVEDLVVTVRLSRDPFGYFNRVRQAVAARRLLRMGVEVGAGSVVSYVALGDSSAPYPSEKPISPACCSTEFYLNALRRAAETILSPLVRAVAGARGGPVPVRASATP